MVDDYDRFNERSRKNIDAFEKEPRDLRASVKIKELTKVSLI
jgi:hypothetical protein